MLSLRKVLVFIGLLALPLLAAGQQQTALPAVYLSMPEELSADTFSDGAFQLITDTDTLSLDCQLRHRGASSKMYDKKSYAVKLVDSNRQKQDTSLLGMRSDNYWILDAMAVDKARMRNRVAMDLWLDFSAKPYYADVEPAMHNGYRGQFVELFVNGAYEGLYCLMERVDRKQLKLKKAKESKINGVLYKSISWQGSFFGELSPYDNTSATWMRYEYTYPDEDSLITWEPLYEAFAFGNTATAEAFAATAAELYDIPVWMDYYLFTVLLSARDNCGKNLYLSYYNKNKNTKLLITPWDIDHSFGRMYNSAEEPSDAVCWSDKALYRRLESDYPNYLTQLLARYASLRQTQWTLERLKQRFGDYFDLFAQTKAAQREEERWSGADGIFLDFAEEEEYIYAWLEQRLRYTDALFQYTDESVNDLSSPSAQPLKMLRDGQIIIRRGEQTYTLTGQRIN